jgi:hypothetical protein
MLGSREFLAVIDADADIRIRRAPANLAGFKPASSLDSDLNDANSCIKGYTRKHLLKIDSENIRVVHHRTEGVVNHIPNKIL